MGVVEINANHSLRANQPKRQRLVWVFTVLERSVLKVRGAWVIVAQDVAVTGVVSIRLDWFRTSSTGLLGTAATADAATAVPTLVKKDTLNAALASGITARAAPTTAPTNAAFLFPSYHQTEETGVAGGLSQFNNVLPNPDRGEQELVLRPNQGLTARQGGVAGVGTVGFLVSLTQE